MARCTDSSCHVGRAGIPHEADESHLATLAAIAEWRAMQPPHRNVVRNEEDKAYVLGLVTGACLTGGLVCLLGVLLGWWR